MHIILWGFEIQTDHQISARRPDQVIVNNKKIKENLPNFAISAEGKVKLKENEKNDKYQDLPRELKNDYWN